MTTPAIIGCGLAALLIGIAVFAVWAVFDHDKVVEEDEHAGIEQWEKW